MELQGIYSVGHHMRIFDFLQFPNDENKVFLVVPGEREADHPQLQSVGQAFEYVDAILEVRRPDPYVYDQSFI